MTGSADDRVLERFLEKRRKNREHGAQYRSYLKWSGKALEAPASVVVGLLLGRLLERWLPEVAPWGTWAGLAFGLAAAVRALYRLVKAYQREDEAGASAPHDAAPDDEARP